MVRDPLSLSSGRGGVHLISYAYNQVHPTPNNPRGRLQSKDTSIKIKFEVMLPRALEGSAWRASRLLRITFAREIRRGQIHT